MKIKKILNNNAVLVSKDRKDYIWIGAGLGFQKKPGQLADESKIEKTFILEQKNAFNRLVTIMEEIPNEYVVLADEIISLSKKELSMELSETLYASLTDHLYNLKRMYQQGIIIPNHISWELKRFYPKEFDLGKKALQLISETLNFIPAEDEAGNIAMHLINAQIADDFSGVDGVQEESQKIRDIIALIRMHNKIEIDEESFAFDRFVTHLRFFFRRIKNGHTSKSKNPLLNHIKEQYGAAYASMLLIEKYLNIEFDDDEKLYLSLHIQKIIENG